MPENYFGIVFVPVPLAGLPEPLFSNDWNPLISFVRASLFLI